MFKFALAALICAQAFAAPHDAEIESHIVGGTQAKEGEFPFAVTLRRVTSGFTCGAALLSDRYVVTAAHCVTDYKAYQIGAGSVNVTSQKLYDVEKIIIHPDFNEIIMNNDIALLRLKTPVKLGGNIQTINFPVKDNLEKKALTIMGWGKTSSADPPSDVLMYLNRPVINKRECARRLNSDIFDTQICVDGKVTSGVCFGDSGSPLLYKGADGNNYLAGVASWGVPCGKGFPEVYTRVSSFDKWLKQNMA